MCSRSRSTRSRRSASRRSRPPSPMARGAAFPHARKAAPRRRRPEQDPGACGRDPRRPRLWHRRAATIETDDPDALGAALRASSRRAAPRPATFRRSAKARLGAACAARTAPRRARPCRRHRAAGRRALWRRRDRIEGCTLCLACVSACPTGALSDDPERPDAAFPRTPASMRPVRGDMPGKGHPAPPAARFSRRHRDGARAEGGGAVPLHPLRQAVRRARARSSASRPSSRASTGCSRVRQRLDVIKMCADCRVVAIADEGLDPFAGAAATAACARPTTTCASAREAHRGTSRDMSAALQAYAPPRSISHARVAGPPDGAR